MNALKYITYMYVCMYVYALKYNIINNIIIICMFVFSIFKNRDENIQASSNNQFEM